MTKKVDYPSAGGSRIDGILLVDLLTRTQKGFRYQAGSLPGHLLQFMIAGKVRQEMNGRQYELNPGDVVWYHEDERVIGQVLKAPWIFYTVNFVAPMIPAPPFDRRVMRGSSVIRKRFEDLLQSWRDLSAPTNQRELRVHAALHLILAELVDPTAKAFSTIPATELWWNIETRFRRNLEHRATLSDLEKLSGKSTATIARSCRAAVGITPMQRLRQVRMSLAQGLLRQSHSTVSEIAFRIGYPRVHEFSRDYRKHFGLAPTQDRKTDK